jgi:hypothetical protein
MSQNAETIRDLAIRVDASYPVTIDEGPNASGGRTWRSVSRPFAELLPAGNEPPVARAITLSSQEEQDALEAALDLALSAKAVDDLGLIEAPRQTVPLMRIRDQLKAPWLRPAR